MHRCPSSGFFPTTRKIIMPSSARVPASDVVAGQSAVHLRDIYPVRRKRRADNPHEQFYYGKILSSAGRL
jgi:hypothetical protein